MKRFAFILLLLPCCGCQEVFNRACNRMFAYRCSAYPVKRKPGDRFIDYDAKPRTWVEVDADGERHPIPTPPGKTDPLNPDESSRPEQ